MALQVIQMSAGCTLEDNAWVLPQGSTAYGIGEPIGLTTTGFTFEMAFTVNYIRNMATLQPVIHSEGDFYIKLVRSKLRAYYAKSASSFVYIDGPVLTVDTDYIVHFVVNESGAKLYINGAIVAQNATGFVRDAAKGNFYIHADGSIFGNAYLGAKYYGLAIYEKALSADEINTNVQAYKERFNLTI